MEFEYEKFLRFVADNGAYKDDRTGTGTHSVFGYQMRFDLAKGFPLITTKRVHTKSMVGELLWMLRGETNVKPLQEQGIRIWNEWADKNGELGPVYGAQWRSWPASSDGYNIDRNIDQISEVIANIQVNPNGRRHVITAWNPADVDDMALPPCHMMFQFYVLDGKLSCQLYQRSADILLGVPFNIASYALLTHIIAAATDLEVGEFIWTGGDCHIYANHTEQVKEQLSREPRPYPQLRFAKRDNFEDYEIEDFHFLGYDPHPAIKAEVAV